MSSIQYISLGSDCSIAYQLHKYNLRQHAYPFDWIRCGINDVIDLLQTDFQFFTEYLELSNKSEKFSIIEDEWNDDESKNIIMKHKKYSITFPHEIADGDNIEEQINKFKEKYNRRIKRFLDIIKDESIKKIFIIISKNEVTDLDKTLSKIAINYELRHIKLDKTKYSSWKKDEYDWQSLFYTLD